MAIYHFSAKVIKRSDGRSAVKASAYRHATKLFDERLGESHNYSYKKGVIYGEIMVPEQAPAWAQAFVASSDQDHQKVSLCAEQLWNTAERFERRKDAQLAREFEFSLPIELNQTQNIALARAFIKEQFVDRGMIADLAMHWDKGNPHVHVMLTMRELLATGFGLKVRGDVKSKAFEMNWNSREFLQTLRAKWAEYANLHLQQQGFDIRIDHRSFAERGIDLVPGIHEGVGARKMHQPDLPLERVAIAEAIRSENLSRIQAEPAILLQKVATQHAQFDRAILAMEANRYLPTGLQFDADSFVTEKAVSSDEATDLAKASTAILDEVQAKYAVFSTRDLAKVINEQSQTAADFTTLMARLQADPALIYLGLGEDGREQYTTRFAFEQEIGLCADAATLSSQFQHGVDVSLVDQTISRFGLNASQSQALKSILYGSDIGVVLGQAGTGKSYMMKAAREVWEASGYRVRGVALSGIAASGLQNDADITSSTLASMRYQLEKGYLRLGERDIVVMDEAGMTDVDDMRYVVSSVRQFGAKIVCIGDIEQTQSLGRGAGLKSLMHEVGFTELTEIMRQRKAEDRQATSWLATGQTPNALDHYARAGQLHHVKTTAEASDALIAQWSDAITQASLSSSLLLAHQNQSVQALNTLARDVMLKRGWVTDMTTVQTTQGELSFGVHDRLLFLKNDKQLGVQNGSFGSIKAIDGTMFTVALDNGQDINMDTTAYQDFTHGYAATVHKTQGVTKDQAYVLIDGHGWDRHLTYVALSRHRERVAIFASEEIHADKTHLYRDLSRYGIKDVVIDYPLGYATRRGFNADALALQAVAQVTKPDSLKTKIKDCWLYLTNYEAYLTKQQAKETAFSQITQHREAARQVAAYADLSALVKQRYHQLKAALPAESPISHHTDYADFYRLQKACQSLAASLEIQAPVIAQAIERNRLNPSQVHEDAQRFARYETVQTAIHAFQTQGSMAAFKACHCIAHDVKSHWGDIQQALSTARVDQQPFMQFIRRQAKRYIHYQATPAERQALKLVDQYETHRIASGRLYAKATDPKTLPWDKTRFTDISQAHRLKRNALAAQLQAHALDVTSLDLLSPLDQAKLTRYATQHRHFERVKRYQQETRPIHQAYMACFIQDNLKSYYPAIKALHVNTQQLQADARHHAYLTTLKALIPDERKAYAIYQAYQQKQREAGAQWHIAKAHPEKTDLLTASQHLWQQRNKLAADLLHTLYRDKLSRFVDHFDIDLKTLTKAAKAYHAECLVQQYCQTASVRERDYLASAILNEKSSYRYVYQYKLSFAVLNQQREQHRYREQLQALTAVERQLFKTVEHYQQLNRHTGKAWSQYFSQKKTGEATPAQLTFCQTLHQQRDRMAYELAIDVERYAPYLTFACIKAAGLEKQAKRYSRLVAREQGIRVQTSNPPHLQSRHAFNYTLKRYDYTRISEALIADTENSYRHIFGEPKSVNAREMRYAGGLIISLQGQHRGAWHDFSGDRTGGGPIQAIQAQLGCDLKTALAQGARLARLSQTEAMTMTPVISKTLKPQVADEAAIAKRMANARYYVNSSQPIQNTLGETYLSQWRAITISDAMHIRYHRRIKDPSSGVHYPGLVVAAHNEKGEITASQTILLDAVTAQKASVDVVKRNRGVVKGSAALLQQGSGSTVIIAEGPETGLSIAAAMPQATVYITLGNFKNAAQLSWIARKHGVDRFYLAADNDGKNSRLEKTVQTVAQALYDEAKIRCYRAKPELNQQNKCDFNDVLKAQGEPSIKAQIEAATLIAVKDRQVYRSEEDIERSLQTNLAELYHEPVKATKQQGDQIILSDSTLTLLQQYQTIQQTVNDQGIMTVDQATQLYQLSQDIQADGFIKKYLGDHQPVEVTYVFVLKTNKISLAQFKEMVSEVTHVKLDTETYSKLETLYQLQDERKQLTIDKFNSLHDKTKQKSIDHQLQDIDAQEKGIIQSLKENKAVWQLIQSESKKVMLSQSKSADIQRMLGRQALNHQSLGEIMNKLDQLEKKHKMQVERLQNKDKSRGRSI